MNRSQAIARAAELHKLNADVGEEARGATRRWVEMTPDRSRPGPVTDTLCWVVEFGGDDGATCDVYLEDASGKLLHKEEYA